MVIIFSVNYSKPIIIVVNKKKRFFRHELERWKINNTRSLVSRELCFEQLGLIGMSDNVEILCNNLV